MEEKLNLILKCLSLKLMLEHGFGDPRVEKLVKEIDEEVFEKVDLTSPYSPRSILEVVSPFILKGDSIGDEDKASGISGDGSETGIEILPKIRIRKTYKKRKHRKMGKRRIKGPKTEVAEGVVHARSEKAEVSSCGDTGEGS